MDRLKELNAELNSLIEKYHNLGEMNVDELEAAWKEIDDIKNEAYAVSSKLLTGLTRDSNGRFKSRDNVEFEIHEIAEISTYVDRLTDRAYYEISRINTPERIDYPPYVEYNEKVDMPEVDELNAKLDELIGKYQDLSGLSVSELETAWREIDEVKNAANALSSKRLDGLTRASNGKFISRDNVEIDIHEIAQLTTAIDELTDRAYDEINRINRFEVEKQQQDEEKEKVRKSFIYETGRKVIDLRRKIRENNNTILKLEEEIKNIRNELSRYNSRGDELLPEQKVRAKSLTKVLDAKEEELRDFKEITSQYKNEEEQLVEDIRSVQNGGPIPQRETQEIVIDNTVSETRGHGNLVSEIQNQNTSEVIVREDSIPSLDHETQIDEDVIEPPEMPIMPIIDRTDLTEQGEITNTNGGTNTGSTDETSTGTNTSTTDTDSTNNEESDLSDDLSDSIEETDDDVPVIPIVKGNNPKLTWKTVAATAVGIGLGAGVFFTAGPLGVGIMTLSGKLAKTLINRKINKLAQVQQLGNNIDVEEVREPQPGLKGAFGRFKSYLGSEEGLRDIKWMINAAIVTGTALTVASSIQNMIEPNVVEPTTVEPTTIEPTTIEPTPIEPTPIEPTPIEPDVLGYEDITLGNNVEGFNISTGHDTAGWAVSDINPEVLNSNYVTSDSIFHRFASINSDGSIGQIIDTRGLSLADFCAQNNIDPASIAVDVARADGASQAWISADQLLNIGGPNL